MSLLQLVVAQGASAADLALHVALGTPGRVPAPLLEALLAAGLPLNQRDREGALLLHAAVRGGDLDALDTLLRQPGASTRVKDRGGNTLMHWTWHTVRSWAWHGRPYSCLLPGLPPGGTGILSLTKYSVDALRFHSSASLYHMCAGA